LHTSSVGRLFDGVAALLGLKWQQSHEAEAAMLLEECAQAYVTEHGFDGLVPFLSAVDFRGLNFPTARLVAEIVAELDAGGDRRAVAARFHLSLVSWVAAVANAREYKQVACSGGVFQNALLVDMCIHYLGPQFTLYFHEELSPNDENIAFGQLVWFDIQQRFQHTKTKAYVLSHSR
ncbi:MAG: carbamoyltransferase HypF, partial [Bacteroidetes bacterium]